MIPIAFRDVEEMKQRKNYSLRIKKHLHLDLGVRH